MLSAEPQKIESLPFFPARQSRGGWGTTLRFWREAQKVACVHAKIIAQQSGPRDRSVEFFFFLRETLYIQRMRRVLAWPRFPKICDLKTALSNTLLPGTTRGSSADLKIIGLFTHQEHSFLVRALLRGGQGRVLHNCLNGPRRGVALGVLSDAKRVFGY